MDIIKTSSAPAAIGPYSQGVISGGLLYTSGQIPLLAETGEIAGEDICAQTEQVMRNLAAVLAEGGCTFADVIKTTCYLQSMDDFAAFNEVYAKYFTNNSPARSCVAVAALPRGAKVEVEAIAKK